MARAGWISAIGGELGFAGEKPEVPEFVPIDIQEEQAKAVRGNI